MTRATQRERRVSRLMLTSLSPDFSAPAMAADHHLLHIPGRMCESPTRLCGPQLTPSHNSVAHILALQQFLIRLCGGEPGEHCGARGAKWQLLAILVSMALGSCHFRITQGSPVLCNTCISSLPKTFFVNSLGSPLLDDPKDPDC